MKCQRFSGKGFLSLDRVRFTSVICWMIIGGTTKNPTSNAVVAITMPTTDPIKIQYDIFTLVGNYLEWKITESQNFLKFVNFITKFSFTFIFTTSS